MFEFIVDEEQRAKAIEAHKIQVDELTVTLNKSVQKTVDEAVAGLKTKNDELLTEKKKVQDALKNFDNIDPVKAREALSFLENNHDAQLIKDGKVDELIEKRTSAMKSDHETRVLELSGKLTENEKAALLYRTLYETKMVDDSLREAAVAAKVRPEAIADILLRGRSVFSLATDGTTEARDHEGKLKKTADGEKVLTVTNWVEDMKKSSPHYWPSSEGIGAFGGGSGGGEDLNDQINRSAAKNDMGLYRKLRAKQEALKKGK